MNERDNWKIMRLKVNRTLNKLAKQISLKFNFETKKLFPTELILFPH